MTAQIRSKALAHIEVGYQRELTYRHSDGSFSAFGQNSTFYSLNQCCEGSTWLTAFVVKSFIQARAHVDYIDQNVISEAIEWLFSKQHSDSGCFKEYGEVHHKELQGGAAGEGASRKDKAKDACLTAYVLIAILNEDPKSKIILNHKDDIHKAIIFITNRLRSFKIDRNDNHNSNNNVYEIALITLALHLAAYNSLSFSSSSINDEAYNQLMKLAKHDDDDALMVHWGEPLSPKKDSFSSNVVPNFIEVESTAYALLTLAARCNYKKNSKDDQYDQDAAISALRWLITKQNSNGGFASTQDTVIGLQALGAIAEMLFSLSPDGKSKLDLSVSVRNHHHQNQKEQQNIFHFNTDNALVLQQIELDPDTDWVEFEVDNGGLKYKSDNVGTAIIQLSYQYNITEPVDKPAFTLFHQFDVQKSNENYIYMNIIVG